MMEVENHDQRLGRILRSLPPGDALFMSQLVEERAEVRQRRLDVRNAAIRAVRHHCPGPDTSKAIAEALAAYFERRWSPVQGLLPTSPEETMRDRLLHRIIELNDEGVLKARRIRDILDGKA